MLQSWPAEAGDSDHGPPHSSTRDLPVSLQEEHDRLWTWYVSSPPEQKFEITG